MVVGCWLLVEKMPNKDERLFWIPAKEINLGYRLFAVISDSIRDPCSLSFLDPDFRRDDNLK